MTIERSKRATLHDVAALAGVSHQTVSRVIHNSPSVSPETEQRVRRVIEELQYQPNMAARSLKTRRSNALHVISFNPFYPLSIGSLLRTAKRLGYDLMFTVIESSLQQEFRTALDVAISHMVDGIIIVTPLPTLSHQKLFEICAHIPSVQIDNFLGLTLPSVVIDQHHGSQLATQHLIDLGHRHIAEISGPIDKQIDAKERHEAWLETLQHNGLSVGPSLITDFSYESGYQAAHSLLDAHANFSAVVAGNDSIAIGAIHAFRERGLRIPDDISIIGFDNVDVAAYIHPPLTTVHQNIHKLCRMAVEYLVELIENPETPCEQRVLAPELIIRASTSAVSKKIS